MTSLFHAPPANTANGTRDSRTQRRALLFFPARPAQQPCKFGSPQTPKEVRNRIRREEEQRRCHMFDLDPGILFSGMAVSTIGLGMFIYGKKRPELKCIIIGLVMCIFPMFVHSLLVMWGLAAAGVAGAAMLPSSD